MILRTDYIVAEISGGPNPRGHTLRRSPSRGRESLRRPVLGGDRGEGIHEIASCASGIGGGRRYCRVGGPVVDHSCFLGLEHPAENRSGAQGFAFHCESVQLVRSGLLYTPRKHNEYAECNFQPWHLIRPTGAYFYKSSEFF